MRAASARLLCAFAALVGCTAPSHAGIPSAFHAADPQMQAQARGAQVGDMRARYGLAVLFRDGDRVSASGGQSPVRAAATARVAAPEATADPAHGNFFLQDRSAPNLSGPLAEILIAIVRVELFSESCFEIAGQREDPDEYADRAWRCVASSELPENCSIASDAVLRSVRFVRVNPNFVVLHEWLAGIIDRCVSRRQRSVNDLYARRAYANFLDLAARNLGHASAAQSRLVDRFASSFEAHADRHPPIGLFAETMCVRLMSGRFVDFAGFWLLFCNSEIPNFASRSGLSRLIDSAITERGVYDWPGN